MIAMRDIEKAAQQCASAHASHIVWKQPASFSHLSYEAPFWTLQVGEQQVRTRLVVGADGTYSSIARTLGIASVPEPYQHVALIARVTWQKAHDGVAWERFCKKNTFAVLPWKGKESIVVWSIDTVSYTHQTLPTKSSV